MTQLFNFSKLKNIYSTAWIDKEHSLAFEVAITSWQASRLEG